MSSSDWHFRFTIGNLTGDSQYGNVKKTFSIPSETYTMITIHKGTDDSNALRHFENDSN